MKFPDVTKRPLIPLSGGEILVGRVLVFAQHRLQIVPFDLFVTNRRMCLADTIKIERIIILHTINLVFLVVLMNLIGQLFAIILFVGGFLACLAYMRLAPPVIVEQCPLESVVSCTSENELSLSKSLRITLIFASGASWQLRPNGANLLRPRDELVLIFKRAGLVVTKKT